MGLLLYAGDIGTYWSSSLLTDDSDNAYCLFFRAGTAYTNHGVRYRGESVRALSE